MGPTLRFEIVSREMVNFYTGKAKNDLLIKPTKFIILVL